MRYGKVPIHCCICAARLDATVRGDGCYNFDDASCSYECHLRKSWRKTLSIMGSVWTLEGENEWLEKQLAKGAH